MKSIILRLGSGSLAQGFPGVYVELQGDGIDGWGESTSLLPDPDLKTKYDAWERVYQATIRLGEWRGVVFHTLGGTQVGPTTIHQVTTDLIAALNHWLSQGDFARIQAQLRTSLHPKDRISLSIITTDDTLLWKLPWHRWDFCKAYAHCVESFSKSNIQSNYQQRLRPNGRVDILAIWGHAPELGLAQDLAALQQPRARVTTCQPKSAVDISDALIKQQQMRILFFGGHGETIELELAANIQSIGTIYLDKDTPISISKIKTDLKQAIERGLQIAIFNCCSGLGLAQELADLNLPYLVVMRSQIPDKLAQKFCQYLLSEYSQGGDFTTAFHCARERLIVETKRDDEFESWLPMLVHNPQSNRVTWADLSRTWWQLPVPQPVLKARQQFNKPDRLPLTWLGISLLSTAVTIGLQTLAPIKQLESLAIDRLQYAQSMTLPEPSHVVVLNINQPIDNDSGMVVIKDPETGRYIINEAHLQDLAAIPFATLGLDVQLEDRRSANSWLDDRQRNITINCDKRSPMMTYSSEQTCPALAWPVTKNFASANRQLEIKTPIILNPHLTSKIPIKQLDDVTKINQTNPAFFKNKIILFGYVEHLNSSTSSVMIHATAAESIASGKGLLTSYTDSIGTGYLLFWAGIGASSIFYRRRLLPLAIVITGGSVVTGPALFLSGALLPLVPAAIVVGASIYSVYLIKCPNESIDT
jgi:hypothetical protein